MRCPTKYQSLITRRLRFLFNSKPDKDFDWNCFVCVLIGLAQIAAGVSLTVLSLGASYYFAQDLIAEGVGDIIFAISSGISGNFSWKLYGQHKVQSLILSILTGGVSKFLSIGGKAAVKGI